MTHAELERIYEQLDDAVAQLEQVEKTLAALAHVLKDVRARLASGGGPGEERK